jgi:CHAD domain-containing protein
MAADEHSEIERKYDVDPGCRIPGVSKLPGTIRTAPVVELDQVATYYDTEDLRLLSAGVTLRRRTGGVDDGWHLKLPASGDRREEVRVPAGADHAAPSALLDRVRGIVRDAPVAPVAVLSTHRRVYRLMDDHGLVLAEFCDDHVRAETSSASPTVEEWREWEIELVDGPEDLLDAAEPILLEAGARPATVTSKLSRALAESLPPRPAWRSREAPGKKSSAAELVSAYLATQLTRLEEQDQLLRRDGDQGVHKLRVAARRMRSALATYAPLFEPDATSELRAELRWLGRVLAEARDAQVLRQRLTALVDKQPPELVLGPVRARLDHELAEKLRSGRAAADEALCGERYFRLLDRLEELLDDPPFSDDAGRAARKVLPDLMRKDLKRLRKRNRRYNKAGSPHASYLALHDVRKAAKRLRYAAESSRPALGKRARRLASRAEAVQELLGEHQDTVVARGLLLEIGARSFLAGEDRFTFGRLHALEEARAERLERALPDKLARLPRKDLRTWLRR